MTSRSNGKLLITGEYLVLDGAKALALPTTFGQELLVVQNESGVIIWQSFDECEELWFEGKFQIKNNEILNDKSKNETLKNHDQSVAERLLQILNAVNTLNPNFFNPVVGYKIKTNQDFNRAWGLGTSSTLINNVANWTNVDAYELLKLTFGGSGYDIACAQYDTPIYYQIIDGKSIVEVADFNPDYREHIYFVYLNQKQNSRDGIANYRDYKGDLNDSITTINSITDNISQCKTYLEFEGLATKHENIISKIINQKPIRERLFEDFDGAIKSLGAWGGDFVMVISDENPKAYFNAKGYHVVIPYTEMIKE